MLTELLSLIYSNAATILFGGICFLFANWLFNQLSHNYPKGPLGLPIVGYLPFLGRNPHKVLVKLAKKYGNVLSVTLGGKRVVVVNGWAANKAVLTSDAFLGKPHDDLFRTFFDNEGFASENGPKWRENRRHALSQLRDLGFGKTEMESRINEEITAVTEEIKKLGDGGKKPVDAHGLMQSSMSNNIFSLIFGKRLEIYNPTRLWLTDLAHEFQDTLSKITILVFFPTALNLLAKLNLSTFKKLQNMNDAFQVFVRKQIKEHEASLDENNVRDYIDGYLLEMKSKEDHSKTKGTKREENGSRPQYFTNKVLEGNVQGLFGAGSATVQMTMEWALLTMAGHQDVQKRVQEEIDRVIGRERQPIFPDKKLMPYTTAVIHEIMRWQTLLVLNLSRRALVDTVVEGIQIPADAEVICNFHSVHYDPEIWSNPEVFDPNRFLSSDGKTAIKREQFIPFAIGKRSCPGETLALVEIFLYFASILQQFKVLPVDGQKVNFEAKIGIGAAPVGPLEFQFIPRK